jgi:hypothetical protein
MHIPVGVCVCVCVCDLGTFFVFVLMDVSTGLWSCQQLWFLIVPPQSGMLL